MSDPQAAAPATPTKPATSLRRRIMVNFAWIGSSQAVIAGLGLISLMLTARALGPAGLGVLALIEAYARSIARLCHPEPWQALIRHGAVSLEQGRPDELGRLAWLSLMVDLAGGLLAALVGVALAGLAVRFLPAAEGQGAWLALAALSLAIVPRPTAMGLLRLYDRFDVLARLDMAIALLRLGLTALAWAAGLGLGAFVALFVIWAVADAVLPFVFARREMARHGHHLRPASPRAVLAAHPGLARLFVTSNINVTLRQLRQRLDVVLLSTVLPAAGLGLYQLARRIGEAALRLGRPLGQILFPEFARLAARGDMARLRRLMLLAALGVAAVILLILAPFAWQMKPLLALVFGPDFAAAAGTVNIMAAAVAAYMAGIICGPALMCLSRDRAMAAITGLSTALFFAALIPVARAWGAEGAAFVHLLTNIVTLILFLAVALRASRHWRPDPAGQRAATGKEASE